MPGLKDLKSEVYARALVTSSFDAKKAEEISGIPAVYATKEIVQARCLELMQDAGLSLADIVKKHGELLHATKFIKGERGVLEEVPDNPSQLKAVELAYRNYGVGLPDATAAGTESTSAQRTLDPERLDNAVRRLEALNRRFYDAAIDVSTDTSDSGETDG